MLVSYLFNLHSDLIGKKWRSAILFELKDGPVRFNCLKDKMNGCSSKILNESLKDMMAAKLVLRVQYLGIPAHVEYSIHPESFYIIELIKIKKQVMLQYCINNPENCKGISKEVMDSILRHR